MLAQAVLDVRLPGRKLMFAASVLIATADDRHCFAGPSFYERRIDFCYRLRVVDYNHLRLVDILSKHIPVHWQTSQTGVCCTNGDTF